jgi:hypothetical protein
MDEPRELHIPDYVPDELIREYGTAPAAAPGLPRRGRRRPHGLALAGCVSLLAAILVALAASSSEPALAAIGILAIVLIAAVVGITLAHCLLRSDRR